MTWDEYFIGMCYYVANRSKDRSTQLGSVIVGPDNEVRSTGYNSFPRGLNDNIPARQERPYKYHFFVHAEHNAILNAARVGIPLKGCRIYVPWIPCAQCALAIIQSGIVEVIYHNDNRPSRWKDSFEVSLMMFDEVGVKVRKLKEKNHE
jgi:dCMP deaminase